MAEGQAQAKETTPEKKLLKIIEGSDGKESSSGKSVVKEYKPKGLFSGALIKGSLQFFFSNLKEKVSLGSIVALDLRKINSLLFFFVFLTAIYFSFSVVKYHKDAQKIIKLSADEMSRNTAINSLLPQAESAIVANSLSLFFSKIKARDLFKPFVKKEVATGAGEVSAISEALKNLHLVGISLSAEPNDSYALIEEASTKMTHFLKKNEEITGVKVLDIQADRVILSYQGQAMELR